MRVISTGTTSLTNPRGPDGPLKTPAPKRSPPSTQVVDSHDSVTAWQETEPPVRASSLTPAEVASHARWARSQQGPPPPPDVNHHAVDQAENDEPQPHDDFAFGLWNLKPEAVSLVT